MNVFAAFNQFIQLLRNQQDLQPFQGGVRSTREKLNKMTENVNGVKNAADQIAQAQEQPVTAYVLDGGESVLYEFFAQRKE